MAHMDGRRMNEWRVCDLPAFTQLSVCLSDRMRVCGIDFLVFCNRVGKGWGATERAVSSTELPNIPNIFGKSFLPKGWGATERAVRCIHACRVAGQV